MPFSVQNLKEIEEHLKNHPTLSEGGVPGPCDASIYLALGKLPEKSANPNLHYWYLFIANFSPVVIQGWADQDKPKEKKDKKDKKDKKKEETKKEEDDDFDPFADEDAAPKPAAKPTPPPAAKAKKPKPIAKSIVIFEVKVYDMETNLDELAKKILKLEIDGLTWNNEPKKLPVAFGMYKLQMGCVIEDDKVLTDDIFQKIQAWQDEVQSVDMTSMQKL